MFVLLHKPVHSITTARLGDDEAVQGLEREPTVIDYAEADDICVDAEHFHEHAVQNVLQKLYNHPIEIMRHSLEKL
jgi:hypothetical protein